MREDDIVTIKFVLGSLNNPDLTLKLKEDNLEKYNDAELKELREKICDLRDDIVKINSIIK